MNSLRPLLALALVLAAAPARAEWCLSCAVCARHTGGPATRCGYASRSDCADTCSQLEASMNLESGTCSCSGADAAAGAAPAALPPVSGDPALMFMGVFLQGEQASSAAKQRSAQELQRNLPEMNRQAAEAAAEAEAARGKRNLTDFHRAREKTRIIRGKMLPPRPAPQPAGAPKTQARPPAARRCPDDPERAYGRQIAVLVDELERLGSARTPDQSQSLTQFAAQLQDIRSRDLACAPPPSLAPRPAPASAARPLDSLHRHLYEAQRRILWALLKKADAQGLVDPADRDACQLRPPLAPDFNSADSAAWNAFDARRRAWVSICQRRREPLPAGEPQNGVPPPSKARPEPIACVVCTDVFERDTRGATELGVINAALGVWKSCLDTCRPAR